jgi:hypothetical protein
MAAAQQIRVMDPSMKDGRRLYGSRAQPEDDQNQSQRRRSQAGMRSVSGR